MGLRAYKKDKMEAELRMITEENAYLVEKNEFLEKKLADYMRMLAECDKKLADYERDFKDIKEALAAADVEVKSVEVKSDGVERVDVKSDDTKEVCLDFKISKPASGTGGDKYESVKDKDFNIYFPQKYSRLGGKVRENMCVKLSCEDNFTDMKITKAAPKKRETAKKETVINNIFVQRAVINRPDNVSVSNLARQEIRKNISEPLNRELQTKLVRFELENVEEH